MGGMRRPLAWAGSLFARLLVMNAVLLSTAAVLLAITPATVSFPATRAQGLTLATGVLLLVAANAVLLRVSLRPLEELAGLMGRIDLLAPGQRLRVAGTRELQSVAATFNDMLDRLEAERRASSSHVVDREEGERRRVSQELHDEVGQRVTAMLLQLRRAIEDAPDALVPQLVEIQGLGRGTLDEVGRLARQLRPAVLDDLGLAYALHGLVDAAEETPGLVCSRRIELDLPTLPSLASVALFRVAQEALTNVIRHAHADHVDLVARRDGETVVLEVRDDGRGMLLAGDVETSGIRGMRERAVAAGGVLQVDSWPGAGTTIRLRVAVPR
jgi:two-component system sensor histidine kinase UhpB